MRERPKHHTTTVTLTVCALLGGCTRERTAPPRPVAVHPAPAPAPAPAAAQPTPAEAPGTPGTPGDADTMAANPTESTAPPPTATAPGTAQPPGLAAGIDAGPPPRLDYGEQVAMAFVPISGELRQCYDQPGGEAVPPNARSVWIVVDPAGHVADAGAGGDASAAVRTCMVAKVHNIHLPPHPASHWYGFPLAPPPGT